MTFNVTVTYADNGRFQNVTETFDQPERATRYARAELAYESTVRVVCEALGFDEFGDFATLIHLPKEITS